MPSTPLIFKYPLDLTGTNVNNKVVSEPHVLATGNNRALVPNYGAFYSATLVVRDANSGVILIPRTQYKATQLYQEATVLTGKEVCAVVIITDPLVSENVEVTYQAVGGEFSYSVTALRDMLETLNLDNRPVNWGDILGTPSSYPPAPHFHDVGEVYGFEFIVSAIQNLQTAIEAGKGYDSVSLQDLQILNLDIRTYINNLMADSGNVNEDILATLLNDLEIALKLYADNKASDLDTSLIDQLKTAELLKHEVKHNPHNLTLNEIGLYQLTNKPKLTIQQLNFVFDINNSLMALLEVNKQALPLP